MLRESTRDQDDAVDVLVVGAGLTGLTTATALHEAGHSVLVVEASSEVGGRTRSRMLNGRIVDIGGELIGASYHHTRQLIHDLGLHLETTQRLPRLHLHPCVSGALRPSGLLALRQIDRRIRDLTQALDPNQPWSHPAAAELDALSVSRWLRQATSHAEARRLVETCAHAFATRAPEQLSMLAFLLWLHPSQGLAAAYRETRWRVREGAQEISRRLTARLPAPVLLNSPVQFVRDTGHGVHVTARDGQTWRARRAALCIPLAATSTVRFTPELSAPHRALLDEIDSPPLTKLIAIPRSASRRGSMSVGEPELPIASLTAHHAMGFAYGTDTSQPAESLLGRLLDALRLGRADIEGTLLQAWHDEPHIRGGYPALLPGQLTAHGPAVRSSSGRIHFGGADRSTWPGTMEGALRDGHRLAKELLDRLRAPTRP